MIGKPLVRLLRGGDEVTGATLVAILRPARGGAPACATLLVAMHLLLVQRQGMSVPLGVLRRLSPGRGCAR